MIRIDPDAGGRVLFEMAFQSKTPLWPTWEQQPPELRRAMAEKAVAICAAMIPDEALQSSAADVH